MSAACITLNCAKIGERKRVHLELADSADMISVLVYEATLYNEKETVH